MHASLLPLSYIRTRSRDSSKTRISCSTAYAGSRRSDWKRATQSWCGCPPPAAVVRATSVAAWCCCLCHERGAFSATASASHQPTRARADLHKGHSAWLHDADRFNASSQRQAPIGMACAFAQLTGLFIDLCHPEFSGNPGPGGSAVTQAQTPVFKKKPATRAGCLKTQVNALRARRGAASR